MMKPQNLKMSNMNLRGAWSMDDSFTFRDLREATVSSIVKELDSPLIIKDIDRR